MGEIIREGKCPECGDLLEREEVNENTDMDGRRGMRVVYITCSNLDCDFEKAI